MNKELEYYSSDNDSLIGFVSLDREVDSFHAMLFDRDSRNKYCLVSMKLDYFSIEKARLGLEKLMVTYVRNEKALKKELPTNDFFTPITKQEQRHPFFDKLLDKDGFFTAAKSVIEELSFHFEDRDGNFVNQFQSLNGFDARIWELYLWCYFREENFHFSYDFDAPDFMIEKMGYEVAIEAVRNRLGIEIVDIPLDEVLTALGTTQIDGGKDGALLIYEALRKVVDKYQQRGFTLRCFDLLSVLHNTGCLALARLNAEGLVAIRSRSYDDKYNNVMHEALLSLCA